MEYAVPVALALGAGLAVGWVVFGVLGGLGRLTRRGVSRARGVDRPEWAPTFWICAACRSSNPPRADRCGRCRRPREAVRPPAVAVPPDVVPDRIAPSAGRPVTLVHDAAAHTDPGVAHWRLTVGGITAGSAADRGGALALLRALDGVETVLVDLRGMSPATYPLGPLIERFSARPFPLDVPCPERGR